MGNFEGKRDTIAVYYKVIIIVTILFTRISMSEWWNTLAQLKEKGFSDQKLFQKSTEKKKGTKHR